MAVNLAAKWSMAAAIGLALCGAGSAALANGGWIPSSTAAYTEVTGTLLETHVAENSPDVVFVFEPGNDSYDPYTCAAAYGDEFCDAFERCLAAHGFDRCYKRFSQ